MSILKSNPQKIIERFILLLRVKFQLNIRYSHSISEIVLDKRILFNYIEIRNVTAYITMVTLNNYKILPRSTLLLN
jgi:hypothetical protein